MFTPEEEQETPMQRSAVCGFKDTVTPSLKNLHISKGKTLWLNLRLETEIDRTRRAPYGIGLMERRKFTRAGYGHTR